MTDFNNRGSIWKNDRKETDTQPDFTGSATIEGVEYWVSGWKRRPDANPRAPALAFSVRRKDEQPAAEPAGGDDFSDPIPFLQHERGSIV